MPVAETAIDEFAPWATAPSLRTGELGGPSRHAGREPDGQRLSLHPLFAPENAPGNVAVVADALGPDATAVVDAIAAAGNNCFETTVSEHDEAMETVQASAHAAVLAFAMAAATCPTSSDADFGRPVRPCRAGDRRRLAGVRRYPADIRRRGRGRRRR